MSVQHLRDLAGAGHWAIYTDNPVLKVADDLWLMYYGPDGYFDQADCDIRVVDMRS